MKKRNLRLKTLSNLRLFAAKIANETYTGTLPIDKARALTYTLSILKELILQSDIENRLKKLEQNLEDQK